MTSVIETPGNRTAHEKEPFAADYADKRRSETRLPELPKIAEIEKAKPFVDCTERRS
jgi:hypothetical protein